MSLLKMKGTFVHLRLVCVIFVFHFHVILSTDAYAYSRQTHKGSREMFTQATTGSKRGNTYRGSNGGYRSSLATEDASKQIVPFGRGRSSEQIDLSMALAFALENVGKLGKMDSRGSSSMISFLHQIGRGTMDIGKMERKSNFDMHRPSTSGLPTVSYLHIKEISKGAQKLNQILRACSNGINFDRYSIEIGKELLKGAIDLEESLRMLVNLQEASEFMVSSQRKSRIRLLEEDEDDDDDTVKVIEQKQLDRPRFSFDKPSGNSHAIQARTGLKQKLLALTYLTEAPNFNHEQQVTTSNPVSHKWSASFVLDNKTAATFPEKKNHPSSSQSKSEKKGIPNVIAKLMGLEELPKHVESKYTSTKESSSKQKTEGTFLKKIAYGSSKTDQSKAKDTENVAPQMVRQKGIQANKTSVIQDAATVLRTEKPLASHNACFEMVVHDGKPPWKDLESEEGIQPLTGTKNATIKINKQQSDLMQSYHITKSHKDIQEKERRQDKSKRKEQKGTEKGEAKEELLKDELQWTASQAQKISEAGKTLQEVGSKESIIQTEKRNANRLLSANHKALQGDLGLQQAHLPQRLGSQEEKHQAEEREQQTVKQKSQVRKQKGSEAVSKSPSKPMHDEMNSQKKHPHLSQATPSKKNSAGQLEAIPSIGLPNISHQEDLVRDRSSAKLKVNMKYSLNMNSDQNANPTDLEAKLEKAKGSIPPVVEEKAVRVPPLQKKQQNTKVKKTKSPRKVDEVMTRRNRTLQNPAKPLKHQISTLQEFKHKRHERTSGSKGREPECARNSKEAKIRVISSNKSEAAVQPLNVAQQSTIEAKQASTLYSPAGDECQIQKEPPRQELVDSGQNMTFKVSNDQQGQELVFVEEPELKSNRTVFGPLIGTHEGSMDISYPSRLDHQKISDSRMHEPLTESENHLKQIVMKNQLFLNTAEALFKLNIPFGILHASGHNYQDEDSRLILDCGYEIMKRKGRRQELAVHPFMKISICSIKVRSLDDLVKQLHKDFEKLKYYGKNGSNGCDAADYLPKMIEREVQNKDPDVNCMWDFGWNEMMVSFIEKDDVIRDVEKHVLNELLDELIKDIMHVNVSI